MCFPFPSLRDFPEVNKKDLDEALYETWPLNWCLVFFCMARGPGVESFTGLKITNELRSDRSSVSGAQPWPQAPAGLSLLARAAHWEDRGLQQSSTTSHLPSSCLEFLEARGACGCTPELLQGDPMFQERREADS